MESSHRGQETLNGGANIKDNVNDDVPPYDPEFDETPISEALSVSSYQRKKPSKPSSLAVIKKSQGI